MILVLKASKQERHKKGTRQGGRFKSKDVDPGVPQKAAEAIKASRHAISKKTDYYQLKTKLTPPSGEISGDSLQLLNSAMSEWRKADANGKVKRKEAMSIGWKISTAGKVLRKPKAVDQKEKPPLSEINLKEAKATINDDGTVTLRDNDGNERVFEKPTMNEHSTKFNGAKDEYRSLREFFEQKAGATKFRLGKHSVAVLDYKSEGRFQSINNTMRWRGMGLDESRIEKALENGSQNMPVVGDGVEPGAMPLKEVDEAIGLLKEITRHTPLQNDTILIRGGYHRGSSALEALLKTEIGKMLPKEDAFMSTTAIENFFGGDAELRVLAPAGTKAAYLNSDPATGSEMSTEQEVLLHPGTRLKVVHREVQEPEWSYTPVTVVYAVVIEQDD